MTMGSGRVRAVVAVAVCAVTLTGCTTLVSGQAVLGAHVVSAGETGAPSPGAPGGAGDQAPSFDLCSLLDWEDLPYDRDGVGGFGPTSDVDKKYDQSCAWTANIGDAKGVTQVLFSMRPTVKVKKPTGSYRIDGEPVKIGAITENKKVVGCVTVLDYAGGKLGIAVDDDKQTFGDPCKQAKDVAKLMAKREPS